MKTPYSTIRLSPGLEVRSKHLPSKLNEDRLEKTQRHAWQGGKIDDEEYLSPRNRGWWNSQTPPVYSYDRSPRGSMIELDRRPHSDRFASHSRLSYPQYQGLQRAALDHRTSLAYEAATTHSRHFQPPQGTHVGGQSTTKNPMNYSVGVPRGEKSTSINLEIPIHTDRSYHNGNAQNDQSGTKGWWSTDAGGTPTLHLNNIYTTNHSQDYRRASQDNQLTQFIRPVPDTHRNLQLPTTLDNRPAPMSLDKRQNYAALDHRQHYADLDHKPSVAALDHKPKYMALEHRPAQMLQKNQPKRTTGLRGKQNMPNHSPNKANQYSNVNPRTNALQNDISPTPYQQHLRQDVFSQSRHFQVPLKRTGSGTDNKGQQQAIQIFISTGSGNDNKEQQQAIQISISVNKRDLQEK